MRARGRLTGLARRTPTGRATAVAVLSLCGPGTALARPTSGQEPPAPAAEPAARVSEAVSELVNGIEYAEDPDISPDGEWIAYVHRRADPIEDRWLGWIVRARADGGAREALTSGPDDRTPRFSPDGRRLAYVAFDDGFRELRVLSLATRRRLDLAVGSRPIGSLAWAPGGDRIAFLRHGSELDDRVHVSVADVSSGAVRQVTATGFPLAALPLDTPLAWAPDGSAILFAADPDWAGSEDGSDDEAGRPEASGAEGAFRPAAAALVEPGIDTEILEIPSSGGSVRRLTSRRGRDGDPAVSPDGRTLVFVATDPGSGEGTPGRLQLVDRSGGLPRPFLEPEGVDPRRPAWTPDGRQILALLDGASGTRLALVGLDGSVRILTDGLGSGPVAARGTASFSLSADSANPRFVATASPPGSPGELVVGGRRPGDAPRRATWINEDLDLDARVVDAEVAVEGGRVARLLMPRAAVDDGTPLPSIVLIDGPCAPPRAAGFDLMSTALAASGHVVLALDPVGRADAALAAADTLAARGDVASDRLLLLERGGDGTLGRLALERSDAFRAAVVHRPPGCGPDRMGADAADTTPLVGPAGGVSDTATVARRPPPADTTVVEPGRAPPLLVIAGAAHPFDEPPSALVRRLRRTLEALRAPDPD